MKTKIKNTLKKIIPSIFDSIGGSILDFDDLRKYGVGVNKINDSCSIDVPSCKDCSFEKHAWIPSYRAGFSATYTFRLDYQTHGNCLRKNNAIILDRKKIVPNGVDSNLAKLSCIIPPFFYQTKRKESVVIAPWPHQWASYGDFVVWILPKIVRLWNSASESEKNNAVVSFPFSVGLWAHEYLEIIGIPKERHVDSTKEKIGLTTNGILITGDDGPICNGWPYDGWPNYFVQNIAHPKEMNSLISKIIKEPNYNNNEKLKLYIVRRNTRRIKNEEIIINKAKEMGYEILDTANYSVKDQVEIFSKAKVIAGVHGAGFANMIWAGEHANIIEVKNPLFDMNCYRICSALKKAKYSVVYENSRSTSKALDYSCAHNDLSINHNALLTELNSDI